jgi:hypothetical protein
VGRMQLRRGEQLRGGGGGGREEKEGGGETFLRKSWIEFNNI